MKGFQSLQRSGDRELDRLQISVCTLDEFNRNYNAVIDKACQELEAELRKLLPEAQKVNDLTLAQATMSINSELRHKENISTYEMHTARQMESGDNLELSDRKLRESQLEARRHGATVTSHTQLKPGDTITPILAQPKHSARDMYIVRAASPGSVPAQKVLHPLVPGSTKFMSMSYNTQPKHVQIINSCWSPQSIH